jgi:hypothetical protein
MAKSALRILDDILLLFVFVYLWSVHQQKRGGIYKYTKDTIQKKMFPTIHPCICISVYSLKKSQPK